MEETKQNKKRDEKRADVIRKTNMYMDTAVNAMTKVTEFDTKIVEANDEYLEKLRQADCSEYDILKINMDRAETETERQAIRDRMAEMKKERYIKDTENKSFYESQQTAHKKYTLQVLTSMAAVTGLVVKFRKPLMTIGKKMIAKR
jgi:hypothetical protein